MIGYHQHIEGDDNDECNQGKEPFFFFNLKYIVHFLIIFSCSISPFVG
jgi:hypothetical protein